VIIKKQNNESFVPVKDFEITNNEPLIPIKDFENDEEKIQNRKNSKPIPVLPTNFKLK
jgi:hypothetical protein